MDHPSGNLLLDGLPDSDLELLQQRLKRIELHKHQVLSIQGETIKHIYFPVNGLVSCRADGAGGETVEIHAVGHEGLVEPAAILTSVAAVTAEVQMRVRPMKLTLTNCVPSSAGQRTCRAHF